MLVLSHDCVLLLRLGQALSALQSSGSIGLGDRNSVVHDGELGPALFLLCQRDLAPHGSQLFPLQDALEFSCCSGVIDFGSGLGQAPQEVPSPLFGLVSVLFELFAHRFVLGFGFSCRVLEGSVDGGGMHESPDLSGAHPASTLVAHDFGPEHLLLEQ